MAVPTQLAFRTLKGIGILNAAPLYQDLAGFSKPEGTIRCCCYSPDGTLFAWASSEEVLVADAALGHVVTTLPAPNVYEVGFSPHGTYMITWQRPSKDEQGNAVKNLRVWRTLDDQAASGGEREVMGQFVQRSQTGWNLQYTSDEKYCARVVTNEVQFYESDNLRSVWNKIYIGGVADLAVSPGKNHSVAVFVPERKSQPASVKLFIVPDFTTPVSQKTFYKGDKVQMKWNLSGTACIVLAMTDVDKTNKNYYGDTTMMLLSTTGFDSRITLDKEGPIHDVSWSPNSKEFGVVYGYMPAKTTIFNARANAVHSFPLGPRNTIAFSPHGRFVLVAGFGNLAGQVDTYDTTDNYQKVSTLEASNASVCEWSPDGLHILFATTSPRLRVDNGIRLYHITGGIQYNQDMAELYHATFRPQSVDLHPLPSNPLGRVHEPHESAKLVLAKAKPAAKAAGAYRPPGARGTATPVHFKREDEGGAAHVPYQPPGFAGRDATTVNGFGKPRRREVPGAEFVDQALPPGAAPGGGVSLTPDNSSLPKGPRKKKSRRAEKSRNSESQSQTAHNTTQASKISASDIGVSLPAANTNMDAGISASNDDRDNSFAGNPNEKKTRSLLKKLRAIEELKMRQATGEKLEATQIQKIQAEELVRRDLNALASGTAN